MSGPIGVALVGLGYWGPALLRNLEAAPESRVLHLIDQDPERAKEAAASLGVQAKCHDNLERALSDPEVAAVVLATPVRSHYPLAKRCLQSGRHVLVEKPLAMTVRECKELETLAKEGDLCLLVGHTFRFNPAVEKVKSIIDQGTLGKVLYIHGRRVNLGRIQADFNALWSFAPHDFSILNHWLGAQPLSVAARGFSYVQEGVEDVVFCTVRYPNGVGAHLHLGWLDPRKVREMTVVGTEKMILFDDVAPQGKIQLFDRRVSPIGISPLRSFADWQLDIRHGDITCPAIDWHEPLRAEINEFLAAITEARCPSVPPAEGTAVTAAIVAAQESLIRGGQEVLLEEVLAED